MLPIVTRRCWSYQNEQHLQISPPPTISPSSTVAKRSDMDRFSENCWTDRSRALRRTRHARHIPAVAAIDAIRAPYQLSAVSQLSRHASSLLQLTTIQPPADGLGSARRHSPKRQDSSHCRCAVVFKLHFVLRKPLGYADKPGRLAGLGWNIRDSPSAIGSGIRMNGSSLASGRSYEWTLVIESEFPNWFAGSRCRECFEHVGGGGF